MSSCGLPGPAPRLRLRTQSRPVVARGDGLRAALPGGGGGSIRLSCCRQPPAPAAVRPSQLGNAAGGAARARDPGVSGGGAGTPDPGVSRSPLLPSPGSAAQADAPGNRRSRVMEPRDPGAPRGVGPDRDTALRAAATADGPRPRHHAPRPQMVSPELLQAPKRARRNPAARVSAALATRPGPASAARRWRTIAVPREPLASCRRRSEGSGGTIVCWRRRSTRSPPGTSSRAFRRSASGYGCR